MTVLAWRASRLSVLNSRVRRAWQILTIAFLMYAVANIVWAFYELVLKEKLAITWTDPLYLSYYPLCFIGLLTFPLRRAARSRLTFTLDAGTVMLGGAVIIWYLILRPFAVAQHASSMETVIALAYPVESTVLLFGVITVLLRRPPREASRVLGILSLAIFFGVIADFGYSYQSLVKTYFGGQWPDYFYMLGFVLMAISAQQQFYSARGDGIDFQGVEKSPFSWLPYAAIAASFSLTSYVVFKHELEHGFLSIAWLCVGAFLITALVVVRQIVALRENSRLLAERAARASEARIAALVRHSSDAISIIDANGRLLYTSPANKFVFGYEGLELHGTQLREIIHPEDRNVALETTAAIRNVPGKPRSVELRVRRRDGEWIYVESVLTNLLDEPSVGGIVINSRDVTERKKAEKALRESEEKLRQAQKMEAIGQLAGGVAHDFNNLLAVIIGYADMLLRRISNEDEPTHRQIQEIKKAGDRAKSLTSQLLAFSRKQVMQPKVLDLNAVINDLDKMLRRLIGEHIDMQTELQTALGKVTADPGQIEQVLLNLAVNARDAMPDGGKLTIKTKDVYIGACFAESHPPLTAGHYVMISVTDTGCGMSDELQARIFEPFFTTKQTGKGTGLGLSTVYGIVQQSGGHIHVASKLGEGTTFNVYLPRVDEPASASAILATSNADLKGTETVLLVEDEDAVRQMAHEILRSNGYQVLNASDGCEAVEVSAHYNGRIDVMVTDVVMPRLGGRELAEKLLLSRPDMRVLYMSGYTDDAIVHHGVLDGRAVLLEKPFTPDALSLKVREVLSAAVS